MRVFQLGGLFGARICYAPDGGAGGGDQYKAIKDAIAEMKGSITQATDGLKKSADDLKTEVKNLGKATDETKAEVDKQLTEVNNMKGRLGEIEQALALIRQGRGGPNGKPNTPGYQVIESEEFKAITAKDKKDPKFSRVFPVKNLITSVTTDTDGAAGALVPVDRQPGLIMPAQRRLTIRALLTPGRTSSNLIEYVEETGFTNAAATQVAEGDPKQQSSLKFALRQKPVITVAHYMRASKQILDDAPQLQSHIDQRLRYGLALEEERQILNGDGSGELDGLINNSTAYVAEFTPTDPTMIDTLRLAMLQAALAEWPASGHVLHPTDWARIELTKDNEGRYIFANPQSVAGPTMWGLPVVATQAMTEDKFLTGAFVPAAQIFDREDSNVAVSTEDQDNFIKNLVTIRAEERLSLVVYRPEALIYGDFGNVS